MSVPSLGIRFEWSDYYSRRRMGGVAVGIIKGIARHYEERDKVEVTLLTPVGEERVQIKVDFLS